MSRTRRRKRPEMELGALISRQYRDGYVRDGTPTHASVGCEHHGSCAWCARNRTHGNKLREPIDLMKEWTNKDAEFHASLLERQQPLGTEFERVLYDNLLDLYEETPYKRGNS